MNVKKGFLVMGLATLLMTAIVAVPHADAGIRFIGPRVGFYYAPAPIWYTPVAPYYGPVAPVVTYVPGPTIGHIKIDARAKGEAIYIDGGYAGQTGKLKSLPLAPGNHQIEVLGSEGQVIFQNMVHVIAGQTVHIDC